MSEITIAPAKISKMGERYIIEIPKDYLEQAKKLHQAKKTIKVNIHVVDFSKV